MTPRTHLATAAMLALALVNLPFFWLARGCEWVGAGLCRVSDAVNDWGMR